MSVSATEAEIWNRAIRPEIGDLSPAAARELLRLHMADDDAERVRELSGKANASDQYESQAFRDHRVTRGPRRHPARRQVYRPSPAKSRFTTFS